MDPYNTNDTHNVLAGPTHQRSKKGRAIIVSSILLLGVILVGAYILFWTPKKEEASKKATPQTALPVEGSKKIDGKPLPGETYVEKMTLSDGREVYVERVAQ